MIERLRRYAVPYQSRRVDAQGKGLARGGRHRRVLVRYRASRC
jgi:hypothetical protein